MTLGRLTPVSGTTVSRVGGTGAVRRRLLEMGFRRNAMVSMVKHAPLSDPIEVVLNGIHISLRRSEAKVVPGEPTA